MCLRNTKTREDNKSEDIQVHLDIFFTSNSNIKNIKNFSLIHINFCNEHTVAGRPRRLSAPLYTQSYCVRYMHLYSGARRGHGGTSSAAWCSRAVCGDDEEMQQNYRTVAKMVTINNGVRSRGGRGAAAPQILEESLSIEYALPPDFGGFCSEIFNSIIN